jgi:hypothetical protein
MDCLPPLLIGRPAEVKIISGLFLVAISQNLPCFTERPEGLQSVPVP